MNEEGQVACRCGQCLTRRCYVRELALYRSMSPYLGLRLTATQSPVPSMNAAASCSPSASPMAVSAHPGPLSGPVERSTALHWSWNILLACSEPRNLVRQAMCTWSEHRRPARPHHAEFYRILPSETVAGYHNGKYMIGAVLQVTWVTSWPSFFGISRLRPPSVTWIRHRHK